MDGTLFHGDMSDVAAQLAPGCLDLVYLDPPFGVGRTFHDRAGSFDDRWEAGLAGFLNWLQVRISAIWPLLAPTGSFFVHLDRRAVHHIKVWLDSTFGVEHFRNEIIWHYTGGGRSRRVFAHKHDTILWYSADRHRWTFNIDAIREPYAPTSGYARSGIRAASGKQYHPHPDGTPPDDVWHLPMINPMAAERVGYPTQKPMRLLERIILAASNPGELVADLCCGSGTTPVVAQQQGRRWLAADISEAAIAITEQRLAATEPPARYHMYTL